MVTRNDAFLFESLWGWMVFFAIAGLLFVIWVIVVMIGNEKWNLRIKNTFFRKAVVLIFMLLWGSGILILAFVIAGWADTGLFLRSGFNLGLMIYASSFLAMFIEDFFQTMESIE